ncbi:MAG TPA: response regulator [Thermodesulfovibrionales bacterium]|nr:response regulator [Thermodesulfovibrionales bacterium]
MARRLLLADDSITIQKVVELVLAEEGYDIKTTGNGEDALSALSSFKPDVVLADIDMPKMNGYQLCEKIKTNPATRNIPVILLAGAFEPLDDELARNVRAEDFIVKPFESQELIDKIHAVLSGETAVKGIAEEEVAVSEVMEGIEPEEDLWTMEEVVSEPLATEALKEETPVEEVSIEEAFGFAEEAEVGAEKEFLQKPAPARSPERVEVAPPRVEYLSKEEVANIVRREVAEKVSSMLSVDMKDIVLSSLIPSLKDSAEKVLWEVAPDLAEKLLKEMLQGALASLTKEVEKVIWETVPDLAESMIAKEIEKIKSGI